MPLTSCQTLGGSAPFTTSNSASVGAVSDGEVLREVDTQVVAPPPLRLSEERAILGEAHTNLPLLQTPLRWWGINE